MICKKITFFKILIIIFIIINLTNTIATEEKTIKFNFITIEEELDNVNAIYTIKNIHTNQEIKGASKAYDLTIILTQGIYDVHILLDNTNTKGYDYYAQTQIMILLETEEINLDIFTIGSAEITTKNEKNEFLSNTLIRIICTGKYGDTGYYYTDELGILLLKKIPEGECEIRTAHRDEIINKKINVQKGELHKIEFIFKSQEKQTKISSLIIILLINLAIILIITTYIIYTRIVKKTKKELTKKEPEKYKEDVYKVLLTKEKNIVNYLLEHKQKEIYQAKISRELKIPKTTLSKILTSLEAKNIITIEKIGKAKKIKLTPWFQNEA